jgi:gliding motility-associated lipoprotein GldH
MKQSGVWLIIAFVALLLASCQSDVVYNNSKPIEGGLWAAKDRISNSFEVDDTLSSHNFFINLRNTTNFQYSNVFLFVHTTFPNGKKSVDTVECVLTDRAGRWLGSGNGFIKDNSVITNKILYNYQKKFPIKGTYKIELEQAMREDPLPEIIDVGIRIEKVNG